MESDRSHSVRSTHEQWRESTLERTQLPRINGVGSALPPSRVRDERFASDSFEPVSQHAQFAVLIADPDGLEGGAGAAMLEGRDRNQPDTDDARWRRPHRARDIGMD